MASFDPYHKWLGIPPKEQPAHHYRLLGIKIFELDADVIDAAGEQRTVFLRSFQTGPHVELAVQLLNEVSEARVCLLDGKSKARYDAQLKAGQQPAQPVAEVTVPEEAPVPLVTPQRSVASKIPSARTRSRRSAAVKPLWQQPWVMATMGAVTVVLVIIFSNSGDNESKPAGNPRGTTTAKVDPKPKVKVPNKKTEEEQKTEQERLDAERAEQERLDAERAEQERLDAERAEQERLAAERAEQERLDAERAEQERLAAARAKRERLAAKRAEQERLDARKAAEKAAALAKIKKTAAYKKALADRYKQQGITYFNQKKYDLALAEFEKAIAANAEDAEAHIHRGTVFITQKNPNNAIAAFTKGIRLEPTKEMEAVAYFNRGAAHILVRAYPEAAEDYGSYIRLKPDDARAYYLRGFAYVENKEYDKAIADFSTFIDRKPADAAGYYNRGRAYSHKTGKTDVLQAIADFTRAIELKPNDFNAWKFRGIAHLRNRDPKQSKRDLDKAKELERKQ